MLRTVGWLMDTTWSGSGRSAGRVGGGGVAINIETAGYTQVLRLRRQQLHPSQLSSPPTLEIPESCAVYLRRRHLTRGNKLRPVVFVEPVGSLVGGLLGAAFDSRTKVAEVVQRGVSSAAFT